MEHAFTDITIALGLATILAIAFKFFKQPSILAYILAGILVGPLHLVEKEGIEVIHAISEIGIVLLLFMIGLEMNIKELRLVGKSSALIGLLQVVLTFGLAFGLSNLLGFDSKESIYISLGLTFSSTIIIIKLLSDKKDLSSLYGKISIGILLIQDFVAILSLIILSGFSSGNTLEASTIIELLLKGVVILIIVALSGTYIFPFLISKLSNSQEILFLFSLAWAFTFAGFVSSDYIGFSIEIGGFLAGLALANTIESVAIVSKVRPLRDFFVTLFFIALGADLVFESVKEIIAPVIVFSIFAILIKPLIIMIIMRFLNQKSRTSFMTGVSLAQISEFSLILAFLGKEVGHVGDEVISLMAIIAIVTFTISTYGILNSNKIFNVLRKDLKMFEKKHVALAEDLGREFKDHVVLIGAHRLGAQVASSIEDKEKLIVVDFNPDIVKDLKHKGYNALFGDISDSDILETAFISDARLVISTIPDVEDNLILLKAIKSEITNVKIIVLAHFKKDEKDLKNAGADYVILPYNIAGNFVSDFINNPSEEIIESLNKMKLSRILRNGFGNLEAQSNKV